MSAPPCLNEKVHLRKPFEVISEATWNSSCSKHTTLLFILAGEASNYFHWFVHSVAAVGKSLGKNVGLAETASKGTPSARRKHITRLQKVQAKTPDQEEVEAVINEPNEHAQKSREARKPKASQNAD